MYMKEIIDPIRSRINKEPVPETRKVESFCSLDCPNECTDASSSVSDSFPLMIADGQGLMEIHILSLQLSTSVSMTRMPLDDTTPRDSLEKGTESFVDRR